MAKVIIDPRDLLDAFDMPEDLEDAFLDVTTGTVVTILGEDDGDTDHDPAKHIDVPRVGSRDEFAWMSAFTESVTDDDVKERLRLALRGQGAFARFRHVLESDRELFAAWLAARQRQMLAFARRWLERIGIDAELSPPLPEPPHVAPTRPKKEPEIDLFDLLLLGAPSGTSESVAVRSVTARSPEHAAGLFKSLARQLAEWHGVPWRRRYGEGEPRFAVERAEVSVEGLRVELRVAITRAAWNMFHGQAP